MFLALSRLQLMTDASGQSRLPDPVGARSKLPPDFQPPETELHRVLALVFECVLRVWPLGLRDNFLELGGDFVSAVKAIGPIRDLLGVELSMKAFFQQPTIAAIAEEIVVVTATRER
jgi:hypothetical protein